MFTFTFFLHFLRFFKIQIDFYVVTYVFSNYVCGNASRGKVGALSNRDVKQVRAIDRTHRVYHVNTSCKQQQENIVTDNVW